MNSFNSALSVYSSSPQHLDFDNDSRDSSTNLLSPVPDLTETVNALTDGYSSASSLSFDQGWSNPLFYGQANNQPNHVYNGDETDMKSFGVGNMTGQDNTGLQGNAMSGDLTQGGISHQAVPSNPFANMPTAMLQRYLAGEFQLPVSSGMPFDQYGLSNASASTGALFQQPKEDQIPSFDSYVGRSPSPLVEMEEDAVGSASSASPEAPEPARTLRRASDGGELPKTKRGHLRRLSVHLPTEEKMQRAQATEGLTKQDKRRVQNKLAQRAFRARSKVFNRLEHLEELTEQQADRIVKMSELVTRLQKENTGLKTSKFEQAMQGITST